MVLGTTAAAVNPAAGSNTSTATPAESTAGEPDTSTYRTATAAMISTAVAAKVIACQRSTYERPRRIKNPKVNAASSSGSQRRPACGSHRPARHTTVSTPSPTSRPVKNDRARSARNSTSRTEAGPSKVGCPPPETTTVVGRSGRASNTHRLVADGNTGSRMPDSQRDSAGAPWYMSTQASSTQVSSVTALVSSTIRASPAAVAAAHSVTSAV